MCRLPPYNCYTIFIHDPVPNDLNELSIVLHTDITVTAETSTVSLVGFPQQKLI